MRAQPVHGHFDACGSTLAEAHRSDAGGLPPPSLWCYARGVGGRFLGRSREGAHHVE